MIFTDMKDARNQLVYTRGESVCILVTSAKATANIDPF